MTASCTILLSPVAAESLSPSSVLGSKMVAPSPLDPAVTEFHVNGASSCTVCFPCCAWLLGPLAHVWGAAVDGRLGAAVHGGTHQGLCLSHLASLCLAGAVAFRLFSTPSAPVATTRFTFPHGPPLPEELLTGSCHTAPPQATQVSPLLLPKYPARLCTFSFLLK